MAIAGAGCLFHRGPKGTSVKSGTLGVSSRQKLWRLDHNLSRSEGFRCQIQRSKFRRQTPQHQVFRFFAIICGQTLIPRLLFTRGRRAC
ncbi:hypothetical protein VUR80DRAFT_2676 [Thermomyces stellatus]